MLTHAGIKNVIIILKMSCQLNKVQRKGNLCSAKTLVHGVICSAIFVVCIGCINIF
jgi:hypothetical protein